MNSTTVQKGKRTIRVKCVCVCTEASCHPDDSRLRASAAYACELLLSDMSCGRTAEGLPPVVACLPRCPPLTNKHAEDEDFQNTAPICRSILSCLKCREGARRCSFHSCWQTSSTASSAHHLLYIERHNPRGGSSGLRNFVLNMEGERLRTLSRIVFPIAV